MSYELESICSKVVDLARETGGFIRNEVKNINAEKIESKGVHNYVTYVDKTAEKKIVSGLMALIENAGFITEEDTVAQEKREYIWIIDPLDGTTNFIHGLPCFSISIGLIRNNVLVLGVIYEINLDECFWAWEGSKAYLNGKEIRVSDKPKLEDSLLATGFPYYNYSRLDKYMELFVWCLRYTHGVRRIGSAAVDLAWVACGRFEAFFEYGLNPWDVAAGAFILQQAGGRVTDFSGGDNYLFGAELVATNTHIHEEFISKTKEVFGLV